MVEISKKEEWFVDTITTDYIPLSDLVGISSKGTEIDPTEEEYIQALDFLRYLTD
jgi:hypothetical protein